MEYTELDIVIKDVKPFSEILIARLNDIDFETFEENTMVSSVIFITIF